MNNKETDKHYSWKGTTHMKTMDKEPKLFTMVKRRGKWGYCFGRKIRWLVNQDLGFRYDHNVARGIFQEVKRLA